MQPISPARDAAPPVPDIRALVTPLLGQGYPALLAPLACTEAEAAYPCWPLVRYLLRTGLALDIEADLEHAAREVAEVWFRGDPRPIGSVAHPWDFVIMAPASGISHHVCLAVNNEYFVHVRQRTGVVLERFTRWQARILQLARVRRLMP